MQLPSHGHAHWQTQECFEDWYGRNAVLDTEGWPETDCCPPDGTQMFDCTSPHLGIAAGIVDVQQGRWADVHAFWPDAVELEAGDPLTEAINLYEAAIALLIENMDIVRWVACLTVSWSPDEVAGPRHLPDCLEKLITGQRDNFVVFIHRFDTDGGESRGVGGDSFDYAGGHTLDDGAVGVVIPVGQSWWRNWIASFDAGDDNAFCAVVGAASVIVHEMVHMCLNNDVLADHVENEPSLSAPCWDEPRMTGSMFRYAMSMRFGACLSQCCNDMSDAHWFAFSGGDPDGPPSEDSGVSYGSPWNCDGH